MARIKQLILAAEEALNHYKPSTEEEAFKIIEEHVTDCEMEIILLAPVIQEWFSE